MGTQHTYPSCLNNVSSKVQINRGMSSMFFICVHLSFLQAQERMNKVYLAMDGKSSPAQTDQPLTQSGKA